ncbi:DEAD/DEAH box helicase, partial [Comamonadaceae bacterium SL12-8]
MPFQIMTDDFNTPADYSTDTAPDMGFDASPLQDLLGRVLVDEEAELAAESAPAPAVAPMLAPVAAKAAPVMAPATAPVQAADVAPAAVAHEPRPRRSKPAADAAPAAPIEAPDTSAFAALGLHPQLLAAVGRLGYTTPTEVQARCIAPALEGKDLRVCSS